jgi:hypothetical protein
MRARRGMNLDYCGGKKMSTFKQRPPNGFDPFRDRLSRDIRNDLSEAFARSLAEAGPGAFEEACAGLLRRDLGASYRIYVEDRRERYRKAFNVVRRYPDDPILHGFVLWDLRLFFEMHEVLEHAWLSAEGNRKRLLQSLIRAAGAYEKLAYGYTAEARRLALKACAGLEKGRNALPTCLDPDPLIASLKSLNPDPPVLLAGHPGCSRDDHSQP